MGTALRATAALSLVAALSLAACGEPTSPRDRLAAASEATFDEGTSNVAMEMDMALGPQGSGMSFTMSGDGALDLEAGTGRMEMTVPGAGSGMAMVFAGDVVYLRLPFEFEGERPWIRQEAGEAPGMRPGRTMGSQPDAWLEALGTVEGEITSLGSDTVRGTDVEGYEFTLEGAKLWGRSDSVPPALRDLEVPTRAWLDAGDRVRRMAMEIDMGRLMEAARQQMEAGDLEAGEEELGGGMASMEGTATMTIDFFDFGADVRVQIPDSSEVMTLEELQERARRSAGADTASGGG